MCARVHQDNVVRPWSGPGIVVVQVQLAAGGVDTSRGAMPPRPLGRSTARGGSPPPSRQTHSQQLSSALPGGAFSKSLYREIYVKDRS